MVERMTAFNGELSQHSMDKERAAKRKKKVREQVPVRWHRLSGGYSIELPASLTQKEVAERIRKHEETALANKLAYDEPLRKGGRQAAKTEQVSAGQTLPRILSAEID